MPTLQILDQAMLRPGPSLPVLGRLGGGQIAMVSPEQPWRIVGLDAAVYQLRQPNGRVLALRFPFADGQDRALQDRYRALAGDPRLAPLKEAPGSPLVGAVAYYPDGLLLPARDLRSEPHAVVVMEWVMGPTLLAAADRACRAGERPYLAALAQSWLATVSALSAHSLLHGDLSADNALVRPGGSIALVDYDTVAWSGGPPPVAGRSNPAYSHPTGQPAPAPPRRDAFAALVLYASLRALAEKPELRPQFGDPTSEPGGALLFSPWDLADPSASPVFGALKGVSPELMVLLRILHQASIGPADRVPPLAEVIPMLSKSRGGEKRAARPVTPTLPPLPPPVPPPAPERAPTVAPVPVHPSGWGQPSDPVAVGNVARQRQALMTRLNSLLMSGDDEAARAFWRSSGLAHDREVVRDYGARIGELERRQAIKRARAAAEANDSVTLLRVWDEARLDTVQAATSLKPMVDAARRRAAKADRLTIALETNDLTAIATLWPELQGDSLVSMVAIRVGDALSRMASETIARAIARGDDPALLAAIQGAESGGVPLGVAARRAGRVAAGREETRRRLAAAMSEGNRGVLAELALSGRLDDLGALDSETTRTVLRALHWPVLADALQSDDDRAIITVYDAQSELYEETGLSREQRARIDLARSRLFWLDEVRIALRNRDIATLKVATRRTPPGAAARLSEVERTRIERLSRRDVAVRRLERFLKDGSDEAILDALGQMKEQGATFPPGFDWSTLRLVEERTALAEGIRRALDANPPDLARLSVLLPAAKAAAVDGKAPVIPGLDLDQLERDVLRAAQIARLRDAIATGDDPTIFAVAVPDSHNAIGSLTPDERRRVDRAVAAQRQEAAAGRR